MKYVFGCTRYEKKSFTKRFRYLKFVPILEKETILNFVISPLCIRQTITQLYEMPWVLIIKKKCLPI